MSRDYLKTAIARSLPRAIEKGVNDGAQIDGKNLPCSVTEVIKNGIVRVKFEVEQAPFTFPEVVVPVFMWEYIRIPIQEGCKGALVSFDAYLGGVTGMGGGVSSLTTPGNLSALMFLPAANSAWDQTDPNTLTMYGVTAAVLKDSKDGTSSVTLNSTGATLAKGSNSVAVTASGVAITGTLTINGDAYLAHTHNGVTVGAGVTGGVTP